MSPRILILETATKNCSVALIEGSKRLFSKDQAQDGFTHAEQLHLFIEEAMQETGTKFSDLKAMAVAEGPGSYTGLRIGVSAAKGIAYASNIPLIAYSSLTAMALDYIAHHAGTNPILSTIDARRMEAYTQIFDAKGNLLQELQASIFDEELREEMKEQFGPFCVLGDAQEKLAELNEVEYIAQANYKYPKASQAASIVFDKFERQDFVDTAYFEPYYLKDFVAGKPKKPLL